MMPCRMLSAMSLKRNHGRLNVDALQVLEFLGWEGVLFDSARKLVILLQITSS